MIFRRADLRRSLKVALLAALPSELAALWLLDKTRDLGVLNGIWLNGFVILGILAANGIHYPAFKLLPATAFFDHRVLSQFVLFVTGYVDLVLLFILLSPLILTLYRAVRWCFSTRYFGSQ